MGKEKGSKRGFGLIELLLVLVIAVFGYYLIKTAYSRSARDSEGAPVRYDEIIKDAKNGVEAVNKRTSGYRE